LEYPTWIQNRRNKAKIWTIERPHGRYELGSTYGLPVHFDKLVLGFLQHRLYATNFKNLKIETTRYEIAKNIFSDQSLGGKNKYDRITNSLKKWKALTIFFEGVFFEGESYTMRGFSIIDEFCIDRETKKISIEFNAAYIKHFINTNFYQIIDFNQYKKLHRNSSARLYEILVKTFKGRIEWAINLQLLAKKMTFEKRKDAKGYYPSDIVRSLKPAVKEINKHTDLCIDFKFNKETDTCVFKKLKQKKSVSYSPATKSNLPKEKKHEKERKAYLKLYETLSDDQKNDILESIKKELFLKYLPDQESRIYAYMSNSKQWNLKEL